MNRLSILTPDLGLSGHAKQVYLLAPALERLGWAVDVQALGPWEFFGGRLLLQGVPVIPQTRSAPHRWRWLRAMGPDVVHAVGLASLRTFALARIGRPSPRLVVSLTGHERLTLLDRWLLNRVSQIVVPHPTAEQTLRSQGLVAPVAVVPPAVAEADGEATGMPEEFGLPPDAKVVITVGRMDRRDRLFDAVWMFEILRWTEPKARLIVVGDGPARDALAEAADRMAPGAELHTTVVGPRADAAGLFANATVAFVPNRQGGVNAALEAMAAGRAVVAVDSPDLRSIIRHGETGLLYPERDRTTAARLVQRLLRDPAERERLGSAARATVRSRHAVGTVADEWNRVYRGGAVLPS